MKRQTIINETSKDLSRRAFDLAGDTGDGHVHQLAMILGEALDRIQELEAEMKHRDTLAQEQRERA